MTSADALAVWSRLPEVTDGIRDTRAACDRLRWHPALARQGEAAIAEASVRATAASAALDGADLPVGVVRDYLRGARPWPAAIDPVAATVRGSAAVTSAAAQLTGTIATAPAQALAQLHVAASFLLLPPGQQGRPRREGETSAELVGLGPPPAAAQAVQRLAHVGELLGSLRDLDRPGGRPPSLVLAAIVHAEIACARPFVRGNALVARAAERVVLRASGLDPTGVCVPELGHLGGGVPGYVGALAAYDSGAAAGVILWFEHCASAIVRGAQEGRQICDSVLRARL